MTVLVFRSMILSDVVGSVVPGLENPFSTEMILFFSITSVIFFLGSLEIPSINVPHQIYVFCEKRIAGSNKEKANNNFRFIYNG